MELFPNDNFSFSLDPDQPAYLISPTPQNIDQTPHDNFHYNHEPSQPTITPPFQTKTPPSSTPMPPVNFEDHGPSITTSLPPMSPIPPSLSPTPQMTEKDRSPSPPSDHIEQSPTPQNIQEKEQPLPSTPLPGPDFYDPSGFKLSQQVRYSKNQPFGYLPKIGFRGELSQDRLEPLLPFSWMSNPYKTHRDYRNSTEPIYPLGYRLIKTWQN